VASANVLLTADDMREMETAAAKIEEQGARGTGNEKHAWSRIAAPGYLESYLGNKYGCGRPVWP
jgi:hypothetical protein